MKKLSVFSESHGYAFIDGRLIECDIKKVRYAFLPDGLKIVITISHADWTEEIAPENFYFSIDDFKSGENKAPNREIWLSSHICRINWGTDKDDFDCLCYVIENGRVEKKTIVLNTLDVHYGQSGHIYDITSPDIPEERYDLLENAVAHLDVEIVNADGSMTKEPSVASLISLTDEQQALVDKLTDLSKQLKDAGVQIVVDWSGVYAFNTNNVSEWLIQYEPEEYTERIDLLSKEFAIDFNAFNANEDDMLCIKRKKD